MNKKHCKLFKITVVSCFIIMFITIALNTCVIASQISEKITKVKSFIGIGIYLKKLDNHIVVIAPIKGGPAQEAGLKEGDIIIAVDDKPTEKLDVSEVAELIRGEKGATVKLTIVKRENMNKQTDILIIRRGITNADTYQLAPPEHEKHYEMDLTYDQKEANKIISKLKDPNENLKLLLTIAFKNKNPSFKFKIVENLTSAHEKYLIELTDNDDSNVREWAMIALGELKDPKTTQALIRLLKNHKDPIVRKLAADALMKIKAEASIDPLIESLNDENGSVKVAASEALREMHTKKAFIPLVKVFEESNGNIGEFAIKDIIATNPDLSSEAKVLVKSWATSKNAKLRAAAISILGSMKDSGELDIICKAVDDDSSVVRLKAILALSNYSEKKAIEALIKATEDEVIFNKCAALSRLKYDGDVRVLNVLRGALNDEDKDVRRVAASALEKIKDESKN